MKVGDKIKIKARFVRYVVHKKIEDTRYPGETSRWKIWKQRDSNTEDGIFLPQDGIFLGYRTLSNGRTSFDGDVGWIYEPKEYIKAYRVILLDGKTNPFYAPAEAVSNNNQ